jgi:hypothetical protein
MNCQGNRQLPCTEFVSSQPHHRQEPCAQPTSSRNPYNGCCRVLVHRYLAALAAGSCMALGDGTTVSPALNEAIAACNQNSASSCHLRAPQQIGSFFDGLTVVPPGIVHASRWRPGSDDGEHSAGQDAIVCGVGLKQQGDALLGPAAGQDSSRDGPLMYLPCTCAGQRPDVPGRERPARRERASARPRPQAGRAGTTRRRRGRGGVLLPSRPRRRVPRVTRRWPPPPRWCRSRRPRPGRVPGRRGRAGSCAACR